MKSVIRLEIFGGSVTQSRPWVSEITGAHPEYKYQRTFLRGKKDYSDANSIGSRGVYRYFLLEENHIYEVYARVSWRRSRRYFCRAERGSVIEMTEEEVRQWLNVD